MRFNQHWELDGRHAFLGASKSAWINYDLDKMKTIWENQFKAREGTELHELAKILIKKRVRLPDVPLTLNLYVNDCIGYFMKPEVVLKFSDNAFGTADAIKFDEDQLELLIFDLKTGSHPAYFHQHHIYAAFFCKEYKKNPHDLRMIFRIYQNNQAYELMGDPNEVERIMKKAEEFDPEIDVMAELMAA